MFAPDRYVWKDSPLRSVEKLEIFESSLYSLPVETRFKLFPRVMVENYIKFTVWMQLCYFATVPVCIGVEPYDNLNILPSVNYCAFKRISFIIRKLRKRNVTSFFIFQIKQSNFQIYMLVCYFETIATKKYCCRYEIIFLILTVCTPLFGSLWDLAKTNLLSFILVNISWIQIQINIIVR